MFMVAKWGEIKEPGQHCPTMKLPARGCSVAGIRHPIINVALISAVGHDIPSYNILKQRLCYMFV